MGAGCCKEEAIDFDGEIELSHFHLLRSVGKGAFGKVRVVQHKRTKEIYALKYINKTKCIRMRAIENIIQERRLLEEVEFPLICNLRYAFQDDENLFMVLDLMLGGDLRFHLERAGPMKEEPDNVLLDEHGHAHLTDFNIAVYYSPAKPLLSIAGSMAYMAPEVLLRKGYFESVDWWSLGVVMFELLFGKRPFRGKSNDLLKNSILRDPLPFPENAREIVSANCIDVLSRLCERDIKKRLGCTPDGLNGFKKHPWFEGIEWDKLVTKEATPPFQPDSKRANFDATHELEELLMEDNPLKAKKRAQTTPETELSTEMQIMEDQFTVYDFTKVKRPHSINRGRILRPSNDPKMSSGTLDGIVTRTSSGRTEHMPMISQPAKVYRSGSPSERVGQDRYNHDEEHLSLTNPGNRSSPLSSPTLGASNSSVSNDDSNRYKADSEKGGYLESQQQQQQQSQQWQKRRQQIQQTYESTPFQTKALDDLLQSEAIILPPSSLPRPLQPRDSATGLRAGTPRQHSDSSSPSLSAHPNAQSSVSSYVTPSSTCSVPPTSQKPVQQHQLQQPSSYLFSLPDSGTTLSSFGPNSNVADPLQDSSSTPPVVRRPVRSRGSSNNTVNSMPAAISPSTANNPRIPTQYQGNDSPDSYQSMSTGRAMNSSQPSSQSYQIHDQQTRPTSAYTPSCRNGSLV
ncbi:hypothetical protein BX616_009757 [Lobosporangium transversale]|nr:hypothetical protein BX616_009757 [Lobosporangium transversale]